MGTSGAAMAAAPSPANIVPREERGFAGSALSPQTPALQGLAAAGTAAPERPKGIIGGAVAGLKEAFKSVTEFGMPQRPSVEGGAKGAGDALSMGLGVPTGIASQKDFNAPQLTPPTMGTSGAAMAAAPSPANIAPREERGFAGSALASQAPALQGLAAAGIAAPERPKGIIGGVIAGAKEGFKERTSNLKEAFRLVTGIGTPQRPPVEGAVARGAGTAFSMGMGVPTGVMPQQDFNAPQLTPPTMGTSGAAMAAAPAPTHTEPKEYSGFAGSNLAQPSSMLRGLSTGGFTPQKPTGIGGVGEGAKTGLQQRTSKLEEVFRKITGIGLPQRPQLGGVPSRIGNASQNTMGVAGVSLPIDAGTQKGIMGQGDLVRNIGPVLDGNASRTIANQGTGFLGKNLIPPPSNIRQGVQDSGKSLLTQMGSQFKPGLTLPTVSTGAQSSTGLLAGLSSLFKPQLSTPSLKDGVGKNAGGKTVGDIHVSVGPISISAGGGGGGGGLDRKGIIDMISPMLEKVGEQTAEYVMQELHRVLSTT